MQTVSYNLIRDKMQTGDILFFESDGSILNWIVSKWTKSEYIHVGMVFKIARRVFILEALPFKGVRMIPLSTRLPFVFCPMKLDWNPLASDVAFKNVGKKYSFFDLIRVAFNKRPNNSGFICTEYLREIYKQLDVDISEWDLTPKSLFERLSIKAFGIYKVI